MSQPFRFSFTPLEISKLGAWLDESTQIYLSILFRSGNNVDWKCWNLDDTCHLPLATCNLGNTDNEIKRIVIVSIWNPTRIRGWNGKPSNSICNPVWTSKKTRYLKHNKTHKTAKFWNPITGWIDRGFNI